jgi:hypothetical protein
VCSFEESMNRLKKVVYKHRIRVKEFLSDFDRLRSGTMHENFFISALSMAGIDRRLSAQQIETIVDAYRVQVTPSLSMIDWVRFVDDVETIFTLKVCSTWPFTRITPEWSGSDCGCCLTADPSTSSSHAGARKISIDDNSIGTF